MAKVVCHFMMSLDGFVAEPGHDMSWLAGVTVPPGLIDRYVESTGAIVAGRRGWDEAIRTHRPYGGRWSGQIFVLTHQADTQPADAGVTYVDELSPERGASDTPSQSPQIQRRSSARRCSSRPRPQ